MSSSVCGYIRAGQQKYNTCGEAWIFQNVIGHNLGYEEEFLAAFEQGKLKSVPNLEAAKAAAREAAANTIRKYNLNNFT